ncbi:MAG: sigma-70 family RNA polymerase sigma factor [Candidatus Nanopelagicales bacterium]
MDPTQREQQIAAHIGLVHHVARHYRSANDYEDIVQAGLLGLIYAVDHFDPERGLAFSTYAVPCITGAIKHHLRDSTSSIRIPGRTQELASRVSRAIEDLTTASNRSPTIPEIASHLSLTTDEVLAAIEAHHARSPISTDDDDLPAALLGQSDTALETVENRESVLQALRALPDLDRRVVDLRFYNDRSQTQIAQELGISQMQVSRVLVRALRQLRELLADA